MQAGPTEYANTHKNGHGPPLVLLDPVSARRVLAEDVRFGLTSQPKSLLPKYFYDSVGSALFQRITQLSEYYCTRAELEILNGWAAEIMETAQPKEVVELGSGSATKAEMLLSTPWGKSGLERYVPFDCDPDAVSRSMERLRSQRPTLEVHGIVGDFERHLVELPSASGARLIAFFGSTIGNLDLAARTALLTAVRDRVGKDGWLLLGVDLVKDANTLELAYNDPDGVTAAFNRNILSVLNNAFGGDFQPEAFRHRAFYNREAARIEMHLVASTAQAVFLRDLGLKISIAAGESIWTENSYKFTRESTAQMLQGAGLRLEGWKTDAQARFALALARPLL